jgi:radical SAM protein with 4Fe4S-binding SPASM domain
MLRKLVPQTLRPAAHLLRRRPRGWWDFLLSSASAALRRPRAWGNPVSITFEPANFCNLRCPVCETGSGDLGRDQAAMSYEDFVTVMDKVGPGANHLMFYFMGEPFLNKDAYRMIRYARDMGLYVTTCTNGEPIDPEALYDSGINHVSFQLGGTTQETHEIYRVRGNLSKELQVLREYLQVIRNKGRKPGEHEVELGFIVMKHNEHQIEDFHKLATDLGVDKAAVISPTVRTPEQGDQFLPEADEHWIFDRVVFDNEHRLAPIRNFADNQCPWIYYAITIQANGDVVACCRDPRGKHVMGNLLKQSLADVWNGARFQAFRRAVRKAQSKVAICSLCSIYGPPAMY